MKVMIVEDEMLLAMELQWEIEAAGHTVVGQAASGAQALELLETSPPEFAFVDIQLQDGPKGIVDLVLGQGAEALPLIERPVPGNAVEGGEAHRRQASLTAALTFGIGAVNATPANAHRLFHGCKPP